MIKLIKYTLIFRFIFIVECRNDTQTNLNDVLLQSFGNLTDDESIGTNILINKTVDDSPSTTLPPPKNIGLLDVELCSGENNTLSKIVLEEIMKDYDPKSVPSAHGVDVEVDVIIQAISSVSEITASFTTDLLFSQIWSDPGLRYDHLTSCIENITLSHRMIDRIWVPNVCFVNR